MKNNSYIVATYRWVRVYYYYYFKEIKMQKYYYCRFFLPQFPSYIYIYIYMKYFFLKKKHI